jgi:hypothetical protein
LATIDEDLQMYKKEPFQRCSEFNMLFHMNFFGVWKSFDLDTRGELTKNFFSIRFVDNFCRRNAFSFEKKRSDYHKSFTVIAEEAELEKIDDEEIRLLNKEAKRPNLTPPGVRI